MSTDRERSRAIADAREFLYDLIDPRRTPKVPSTVRVRARTVLKHFPLGEGDDASL